MFRKDSWCKANVDTHIFISAGFDGLCFQAKKKEGIQ
jgi:hypothetical protein